VIERNTDLFILQFAIMPRNDYLAAARKTTCNKSDIEKKDTGQRYCIKRYLRIMTEECSIDQLVDTVCKAS
jgi:hypothetical protein